MVRVQCARPPTHRTSLNSQTMRGQWEYSPPKGEYSSRALQTRTARPEPPPSQAAPGPEASTRPPPPSRPFRRHQWGPGRCCLGRGCARLPPGPKGRRRRGRFRSLARAGASTYGETHNAQLKQYSHIQARNNAHVSRRPNFPGPHYCRAWACV
jgi:hypothetical protein